MLALREYQPMDDLRRVDWKATARAQRLIVREFSAEDERRMTVVFEPFLPESSTEKKTTLRERIKAEQTGKNSAPEFEQFEKGVSLTASLLSHFTEEQAEIRLVIGDEIGEFGIGREHFQKCLKRLAVTEPNFANEGKTSFETFEEIFSENENSYTFFLTAQRESNFSDEIVQKAKIINF